MFKRSLFMLKKNRSKALFIPTRETQIALQTGERFAGVRFPKKEAKEGGFLGRHKTDGQLKNVIVPEEGKGKMGFSGNSIN